VKNSRPPIPASLTVAINELRGQRLAILGVGQELRGDDAAGLLVVRRLQALCAPRPDLLLLETGPVPENFLGPLRRFAPAWVVFIDAAQMDAAPGALAWIDWDQADGCGGSTHTLSLAVLARLLQAEIGCLSGLIGIQAASNAFDAPVSAPVALAATQLAEALAAALAA
jgi:hydrogenase maturation protease